MKMRTSFGGATPQPPHPRAAKNSRTAVVIQSWTSSRYTERFLVTNLCNVQSFPFLLPSELLCLQDEVTTVPKVQKKHKKATDANLFDDNIDIFADLTDPVKPRQKSKTKGETRSIFDDDMGKLPPKHTHSNSCDYTVCGHQPV